MDGTRFDAHLGPPPVRGTDTVWTVLCGHAERSPDAPFLLFEAAPREVVEVSYRTMVERVRVAATVLANQGIGPGDRFAILGSNRPEFYDAWFAAALLGATAVPLNPSSTIAELEFVLAHAGCRVVAAEADLMPGAKEAAGSAVTVLDLTHEWAGSTVSDAGPVTGAASAGDPLAVLYTSGTTSRPKGVLVSHAAYLHAGDAVAGHLRLRPDDRQLVVLPLFHGNAQYYSTMSALVTGASIALTPRFSASRWSEQAHVLGATVASVFAAPIRMILAAPPSDHDTAHRLRVAMFAQNVTEAQAAEFERRFAVPLVQLYGMTETVVPTTINPLYERRAWQSIGRPLPGVRVRVLSAAGTDAAPGEPGELLVHGQPGRTMMSGYLDDPQATSLAIRDGWLHTGDTVSADADGYLYFVDRRKDMIKRSGENVASAEVEAVVAQHPAVFDTAVVGVPDDMRDEAIHAFVVLHAGARASEAELLAHCRVRLAPFKVPQAIRFVAELPRTSVGKVQKHLLRGIPE